MGRGKELLKRLRDAILHVFENYKQKDPGRQRQEVTRRTRTYAQGRDTVWIPFTGGIRVPTNLSHVLVEVDARGGISHLVACWHFLARNAGGNPPQVTLSNVFIAPTGSSGNVQRKLWDFIVKKVEGEFGARFQAHFETCVRPAGLDNHAGISPEVIAHCRNQLEDQDILERFRRSLLEEVPGTATCDNLLPAAFVDQGWREP